MDYPTPDELKADGIDAVTIQRIAKTCVVYGHGEYPDDSVLSGQSRKLYLASFPTLDEALEAFPNAYVID